MVTTYGEDKIVTIFVRSFDDVFPEAFYPNLTDSTIAARSVEIMSSVYDVISATWTDPVRLTHDDVSGILTFGAFTYCFCDFNQTLTHLCVRSQIHTTHCP